MSTVATRRRSWLVSAGIAVALALPLSVGVVLVWEHSRTSSGPSQPFSAAPAAEQARWEVETVPAGAITHVTKSTRALVEKQGAAVEHVVRNVYDTQLMNPRDLDKTLRESFTADAAKSFENAKLGVPKGATDVKSTRRIARIGVNVDGARAAAVDVTIALEGKLKGQALRLTERSTLWLQRGDEGNWRVVGFDVRQGPNAGGKQAANGGSKQSQGAHK